jgi:hypothetical protein
MATKTKASEPTPVSTDLDAHKEDLARRAKERDERVSYEERMRLTKPKYAAECELRKPVYKWTVEATIFEHNPPEKRDRYDFSDDEEDEPFVTRLVKATVIAQNEKDAWAEFCDKIKTWPNPRLAKPKFTRGAQVDPLKRAVQSAALSSGK